MADQVVLGTGVYAIRNTRNGKVYVGSASKSFKVRWQLHKTKLKSRTHFNRHLQSAWDKYGMDAFEFVILERCVAGDCLAREQHWIDHYEAYDRKKGYNGRKKAESNLGHKFGPMSEENKAKRRKPSKRKGCTHTEEARAKLKASLTGRKLSEEHKRNIAKARTGTKRSEETKRRMSLGRRGKHLGPFSEEHRMKLSAAAKRRATPEWRASMSAKLRQAFSTPEMKAARSEWVRKGHTPEYRKAMSKKTKEIWEKRKAKIQTDYVQLSLWDD